MIVHHIHGALEVHGYRDIEHAIAILGWDCLNDAKEINEEDQQHLDIIRLKNRVSMIPETVDDARAALQWWYDHLKKGGLEDGIISQEF